MPEFVQPAALGFIRSRFAQEDEHLRRIAQAVDRARLPRVSPEAGRTLQFLVAALRLKRGVEVGTCLGYSTLWIARGLPPGGRLETLDVDQERSERAQEFLREAGVGGKVRFRVGDAHVDLAERRARSLDFLFIDADKEGMPDYLRQAERLLKPGGLLAADNVFWQGSAFARAGGPDGADAVRAFNDLVAENRAFDPVVLPLGDGLLLARHR